MLLLYIEGVQQVFSYILLFVFYVGYIMYLVLFVIDDELFYVSVLFVQLEVNIWEENSVIIKFYVLENVMVCIGSIK